MPPAREDVTEIDGDTYGPLKVACENIVETIYGNRATILRPQIVAGPHDPSGRFTYWARRATLGGEMLAPGDGSDHVQVIDVRDVERFARTVIESGIAGAFNLAGPRLTWTEFMRALGAPNVVWVPASFLEKEEVLPMYRPEYGTYAGLMDVSNEKAVAAGLTLTGTDATIRDTKTWLAGRDFVLPLPPERLHLAHRTRQRRFS